jgi:hypothetical protein
MSIRSLSGLFFISLLAVSSVQAADPGHDASPNAGASSQAEATPKLTLMPPRADVLKDGFVYLPFKVENMTILPLYTEIHGADVTKLHPKIGHLHVMVDNSGWSWIHALTDPIYFGPLSKGSHTISIELVDAAHAVIEVQSIKVVVP